jgi:hypothetical protein
MWFQAKEVDPIEQPVEFLARERQRLCFILSTRPREAVSFEPLVPEHKATALPVQQLHLVAFAIAEAKDVRSEGIELQDLFHGDRQAVDRVSHIDDIPAKVDLDVIERAYHERRATAWKSSSRERAARGTSHSITVPLGSRTRLRPALLEPAPW